MDSLNVAKTIAEQIGHKAFVMLGARDLVRDGFRSLQFRIGRNPERVTHLRIVLRDDDTYNVEAWRIRGGNAIPIHTTQAVYVENLHQVISDFTGLRTSL